MSFYKPITIEYGVAKVPVVATYHTITSCTIDSGLLPVFDGNGNITEDGNPSILVISSYIDGASYLANRGRVEAAIRNKVYSIPMMVMYQSQRTMQSTTPEAQAYAYVRTIDPEFFDAVDV